MIKEAIQKVLDISLPTRFDIDGRTFLVSAGQINREVMPSHTFSLHDMEGDRWIAETLSKLQREIFAKCLGKIDVY